MGKIRNDRPSENVRLLERLRAGDRPALADLFQRHRDPLRRMVELRTDSRLCGRIDFSDALQCGFLDVAKPVENWQQSRAETAVVLGITEEAGAKRYFRALTKPKPILAAMPGSFEGF